MGDVVVLIVFAIVMASGHGLLKGCSSSDGGHSAAWNEGYSRGQENGREDRNKAQYDLMNPDSLGQLTEPIRRFTVPAEMSGGHFLTQTVDAGKDPGKNLKG
jgi:hypothetical protein